MPLRLLRAADERLQLRKQLGDDAEIQREREADRRPRREQQLLDLAPDALGRQIVERNLAAERALSPVRARTRSARRTARRAARAGCRRRTSRGSTTRSSRRSRSPRPSNGSRYSPVSGSHEIALMVKSRRRAASAIDIAGIAGHVEAAVAAAGFRLAARQRDVDVADLVDLKALADRLDAAERFEQRAQALRRQGRTPRDRCRFLDVGAPSSRSRTQPPTIERAAAGVAHGGGDVDEPVRPPRNGVAERITSNEQRQRRNASCGRVARHSVALLRALLRSPLPPSSAPASVCVRTASPAIGEPGRDRVSMTSAARLGVRVDLRNRAVRSPARSRRRPSRRSAAGPCARVTVAPDSRVITSKNSVSVETGYTTLT